jgi:hypothetical protein
MSDKKNDPGTGRYWNRRNNPPKVVRRLGTFDSRKPGQSPKEMKKLLEDADKTLKSTKMKPETQGSTETGKLQDKRLKINVAGTNEPRIKIGRNYLYDLSKAIISSNKPESEKVRNPLTVHDRSTGGQRRHHGDYIRQSIYKRVPPQIHSAMTATYPSKTGVIGAEVTRNPMLRKSATDKVKDRVSLNKGLSEFRDNQLYRRIDKDNTKSIKEANRKKPIQGTFRTQGKQRILEGNMKKPITVKLPGSNKLGGQDSSFHDLKYSGKTGRELSKFQHSSSGLGEYLDPDQIDHQNNIRRRRHRQQLGSLTTKGKQKLLEGGSPKRSITARAGAGLGWLKRKYLSYGASHWRKSKTH